MSSKRKNTPTKLAKDDILLQQQQALQEDRDMSGDEAVVMRELENESTHLESTNSYKRHYADRNSTVSMAASENGERQEDSDSGSSSTERPPTNKKQRLLQSVRLYSPDTTEHIMSGDNNNTIHHTQKLSPTPEQVNHHNSFSHLYNQKKSMDSVLRKLNSKAEMVRGDTEQQQNGVNDSLLDSISSVIEGSESVEDKERRLSDMISQLQSIKESLVHYKPSKVRTIYHERLLIILYFLTFDFS